jgi:predicted O-methyltransferase YrrM
MLDKMVSTLQAQLFVWLASDRKARKILEIGCFSGMLIPRAI